MNSKQDRVLLGMLTPSSNTTLEPVTARMLAGLPEVSAHAGRFRVTEISMGTGALGQFDMSPMLAAADLLADARCNAICWNGTSAGWLGFDRDRQLCAEIQELLEPSIGGLGFQKPVSFGLQLLNAAAQLFIFRLQTGKRVQVVTQIFKPTCHRMGSHLQRA